MKTLLLTIALGLFMAASAGAEPKSCEALKAEIEAKVQANGVMSYTLEIVPNAEVTDPSMVVGSCDNGTKKIIYQRNDN